MGKGAAGHVGARAVGERLLELLDGRHHPGARKPRECAMPMARAIMVVAYPHAAPGIGRFGLAHGPR
ncbi:MAG: hypothetical protein M3417_13915 [Actinomycetota bacterium]|nr:hypothetical protein [Actinomycetota bacterium]